MSWIRPCGPDGVGRVDTARHDQGGVDDGSSDSAAIIRRMGAVLPNVVRDAGSDGQELCALGIGSRAHKCGGIIQVAQVTRSLGAGRSRHAWVGRWRSESRRVKRRGMRRMLRIAALGTADGADADVKTMQASMPEGFQRDSQECRTGQQVCSREEARNRRRRQLGGTRRLCGHPPLAALRKLG